MTALSFLDSVNARWVEADREVGEARWRNSRVLAFALLLIGPHIPRLGAVADTPEQLIDSTLRFPAGALSSAPSTPLILFSIVPVIAAAFAMAGRSVRISGGFAAASLVVGNSMLYSVEGKIVHHQWTAIVLFAMAVTTWANPSVGVGRWSPRFLLSWLLAWGLSTSAIVKVRGGWLDPSFSAVRAELEHQSVRQLRLTEPASLVRDVLGDSFLWELADYATVLLEVGLIFAVLRPAWFRRGIVLMTIFHVAILLLMGISFVGILPAYVPFVAALLPQRQLPRLGWLAAALGIASGATVIATRPDLTGVALSWSPLPDYAESGLALLLIPLLAVIHLVRTQRSGSSAFHQ